MKTLKYLLAFLFGSTIWFMVGAVSRTSVAHPDWGIKKTELRPLTKPNASACDSEFETVAYIYSIMNSDNRYGFRIGWERARGEMPESVIRCLL